MIDGLDYIVRRVSVDEVHRRTEEFVSLYREVYAEPPYHEGEEDVAAFVERLDQESRSNGFSLVAAEADGTLLGYAYGLAYAPYRWWDDADPEPADLRGRAKFAVMEFMIRAKQRGKGIGRALITTLLADRPEPFATLCSNPAAPARKVYERWGWEVAGQTRPPRLPPMEILQLSLMRS